ncbi:hypothetical protein C453_12581 [Haloferax elongans ATCC BAA-1513]|uniref:CARDB domain-containing protein n=1 Tax=Haloferax elongans ATCC BAA-1513 TaxID=1230453 RepID=M0HM30_HALEO|nr:hypothetical protein [Haloferax elongans]ELZ84853.1 hypothetical protein C453_12581 [Haloferax elongans ATCC BAA-1513]
MSPRGHVFALVAVVLLLTSSVGTVVAVPDARLTVSDAAVLPETPVVGEQVVVSVSIANSVASPDAARIDEVRLSDPVDDLDVRARTLGSLSPGDSVTVPVALTFETAGARTLSLTVLGTDEDGDRVRVERPVPIAVEDAPPLVDVAVSDAVVDSETRIQVSLSNPTTADIRNIVVSVDSFDGEALVGTASVATLPDGATEVRNLTVVPAASGDLPVALRVNYTTASGTEKSFVTETRAQVGEFSDDVQLSLRPIREDDGATTDASTLASLLGGGAAGVAFGGGGGVTDGADESTTEDVAGFEVVVTNFGSAPVSDVVVETEWSNGTLPRLSIPGPIEPGASAAATVDLSEVRTAGPLSMTASYRVGVASGTSTTTLDYRPAVADVAVTDLDVTVEDGELRIVGNIVNRGLGEASGVVVELVEGESVAPQYPQRDYFVGRVTPSDFAPFELTGLVSEEATDVTVRTRYTIGGVEVVHDHVVDLPEDEQDGGFAVGSLGNVGTVAGSEQHAAVSRIDPATRGVALAVFVTLLALPVAAALRIRRETG